MRWLRHLAPSRYQGADMPKGCLLKTLLCVAPFICSDTEPIHPVTVAMDYHGGLCNLQLCLVAAGGKASGASPKTPVTCMLGLPKFQSDDTRAPFSVSIVPLTSDARHNLSSVIFSSVLGAGAGSKLVFLIPWKCRIRVTIVNALHPSCCVNHLPRKQMQKNLFDGMRRILALRKERSSKIRVKHVFSQHRQVIHRHTGFIPGLANNQPNNTVFPKRSTPQNRMDLLVPQDEALMSGIAVLVTRAPGRNHLSMPNVPNANTHNAAIVR
ncbi:hypothetical protein DTO271G3_7371 [Paecilomyces variotii]|nr:hypothetical protein DTO271G3_7371 [Paecilomyces variotii]